MKRRGFSLIEILVAMAVMALVLVLMLQIVNGVLQSVRVQNQQMDSLAAARRAIDVLAVDLRHAVYGQDASVLIPAVAGSNLISLLTQRRGPTDDPQHRFLAVRYATNARHELFRHYGSVSITATNLLNAAAVPPENTLPFVSGVLGFRSYVVTDDDVVDSTAPAAPNWATNVYNGISVPNGWKALLTRNAEAASELTNRARALEVWMAAIDEQNYRLLGDIGQIPTATALFVSDPKNWRAEVDNSSLPPAVKSSIRVLHRSIPLP